MFKKKKNLPPSPKALLREWGIQDDYLELIAYNYRKTEKGFEKIHGITLVRKETIDVYEEGTLLHSYKVKDMDGALMLLDNGSTRLVIKSGEKRYLIATADLKNKDRFGAYTQALSHYFEEGFYKTPGCIKERTCPKCGLPYRPGSNTCARCGSKKKQIEWLFGLLKPLIPALIFSFFIFLTISLMGLISPKISKWMVDGYLKNPEASSKDISSYLMVVLAMLSVTLIIRILAVFRTMLSAKIGCKAITRLRDVVFDKVQNLTLAGVNRRTTGELMQRVSRDTNVLKNFLTNEIGNILDKVVTLCATTGLLIYYDVKYDTYLTLMVLVPAIPGALIFYLYRRHIQKIYHVEWLATSEANTILHDIFSGIRVVKAFGRENDEIKRYDKSIFKLNRISKRNERFWALFSPIINNIICMGEFFILFFVGSKILNMEMTLGEMTEITAYASMIYNPLRSMVFIPQRIMNAKTSISKIYDLIVDEDTVSHLHDTVDKEIQGNVKLNDVSFGYEAGRPVLKHINLDIKPGEMIGLVGRSGCGKSTLTNLIMHLYSAEEGSVTIDGENIENLSPKCLSKNVGAVLQETFLFSGTIKDNIAYARPDATMEEIISAAKMAGAHEFIMNQQDGYDTQVGEKGSTLSGGERQRISIARALLLDPKILILDEATSALDTETEKQIQEALSKLTEGRTTIAIAHRLSTLRNATRIVVLDHFGIAEEGTHDELMKNEDGIYYGLVMAQRQMSSKRQKDNIPA